MSVMEIDSCTTLAAPQGRATVDFEDWGDA